MYPSEQHSAKETSRKEPWLAVNLSRLLPGIGQIYAGKRLKGYIILLSHLLLIGIGGWLILGSINNPLIGIAVLTAALLVLPIWNLFDAHQSARSANSLRFESTRKQSKDAWLAVFLSSFIPGLGHAYLKQWLPSTLFFITFIAIAVVAVSKNSVIALIANLLQIILILIVLYHVYNAAPGRREQSQRTIMLFIAGFVGISVVLSTILAAATRQFVAETRYIPSGAMLPTLQINDRLVIDKLAYRFRRPKRGEIVVFSPTQTLQKQNFHDAFIKRIIGLPGDKVQVKDGQVYINDQPMTETYISDKPQYKWGPAIIPPNSYFVLGDNRNNSYDSHYWGFVPRENIIGKATQRFYPFDRAGSLVGK
ncbi:signal peptidase I [Leptolyngbya sp. FACHB-321]|uniref:signal peptidase I n=1 Tax=Leptolyngbya sp. FACHB-321 TaxID=2692807 RepID=UPI001688E967|nr:signal peptidase I [Leptolyngbya sp. FACHB-321]MBD2036208.1 signal peptidase I [Leptolyngbya sp. FACHB-321]